MSCWLAWATRRAQRRPFIHPRSHAAAFQPAQFDAKKFFRDDEPLNAPWIARAVCPDLEPGDVVFFHCRTLHAAQGNNSDRVKLSLVHTYHPQSCHPLPGTLGQPAGRAAGRLSPASAAPAQPPQQQRRQRNGGHVELQRAGEGLRIAVAGAAPAPASSAPLNSMPAAATPSAAPTCCNVDTTPAAMPA